MAYRALWVAMVAYSWLILDAAAAANTTLAVDPTLPVAIASVASLRTFASRGCVLMPQSSPGSSQRTLVLVADDYSGGVLVVDATNPLSPHLVASWKDGSWVFNVAVSPSGQYVFATDGNSGALHVLSWDGTQLVYLTSLTSESCFMMGEIVLSPADATVLFTPCSDEGVMLINVSTAASPRIVGRLNTTNAANSLSAGGSRLVAGTARGVYVWSFSPTTTASFLSQSPTIFFSQYSFDATVFDSTRSRIFAISGDVVVRLLLNGTYTFAFPNDTPRSLAVRQDGTYLVVGCVNGVQLFLTNDDDDDDIVSLGFGRSPASIASAVLFHPTVPQIVILSGYTSGVLLFRVSTLAPFLSNQVVLLSSVVLMDFALEIVLDDAEKVAYVSIWQRGLQSVNVSNRFGALTSMGYTAGWGGRGNARAAALQPTRARAWVAQDSNGNGLLAVGLNQPAASPLPIVAVLPLGFGRFVLSSMPSVPGSEAVVVFCSSTGLHFLNSSLASTAPYFSIASPCGRVAVSKTAPTLFFVTNCSVVIVDVADVWAPVVSDRPLSIPSECVYNVAPSPTGAFLAVLTLSSALQLLDMRNATVDAQPVWTTPQNCENSYKAVWSADGATLFVNDANEGLKVFRVFDSVLLANNIYALAPQLVFNFKTPGSTRAMAVSSDGMVGFLVDGMSGLHALALGSAIVCVPIVQSADGLAFNAILRVGISNKVTFHLFDRFGDSLQGTIVTAKLVTDPAKPYDPLPYWFTVNFESMIAFGVPPKEYSSQQMILSLSIDLISGSGPMSSTWAYVFVEPSLILSRVETTRPLGDKANSIQVATPASIVAVSIVNSLPQAGVFLIEAFGAVAASYNVRTGLLNAVGTTADVNAMLSSLRIAIVDATVIRHATFWVTVDDTVNVPQSINCTVSAFFENVPPVLRPGASLPNVAVQQGSAFEFTVNASLAFDDRDDTLRFLASGVNGSLLPAWLSYGTAFSTIVFSGFTNLNIVVDIVITASDGYHEASLGFTLSVTNSAPWIAWVPPSPQVFQLGASFAVNVSGVFATQPGKTLQLSAALSDGTALPSWVLFDRANAMLRGVSVMTPGSPTDVNYSATLAVVLGAFDGFSSATCAVNLTFVDAVPVVLCNLSAVVVKPMTTMVARIPADCFANPPPQPDGSKKTALVFSARSAPAWVHFDAFSLVLTVSPGATQNGLTTSIAIVASGGFLSTSMIVALEVLRNVPPAPSDAESVPRSAVWYINTQSTFGPCAVQFINAQNNSLSYTASQPGGSPLPSWMQFDGNLGMLSGRPSVDALGQVSVVLTATDAMHASANVTVHLVVERSTLDEFVFVITICGYVGSAVGPLLAAYAYRIFLMNLIRGKKNKLCASTAFDAKDLTFHMVFPEVDSVQAFYINDGRDSAVLTRLLPMLQCSFYLHLLASQTPLVNKDKLPLWLLFDHTDCTLVIDSDAILSAHKPVNIVVKDAEGLIYCVVYVDPAAYGTSASKALLPRSPLERCRVGGTLPRQPFGPAMPTHSSDSRYVPPPPIHPIEEDDATHRYMTELQPIATSMAPLRSRSESTAFPPMTQSLCIDVVQPMRGRGDRSCSASERAGGVVLDVRQGNDSNGDAQPCHADDERLL